VCGECVVFGEFAGHLTGRGFGEATVSKQSGQFIEFLLGHVAQLGPLFGDQCSFAVALARH
jgi:hypothetical protein